MDIKDILKNIIDQITLKEVELQKIKEELVKLNKARKAFENK